MLVLVGTVQDAKEFARSAAEKFQKRDYAGAIEDLSRAIELDPKEYRIYGLRGAAKLEVGDWDGALLDYNKVIELNPSNALGYSGRASAKHRKNDLAGAIQDYSEALTRAPRTADHWVNRGAVKLQNDDYPGAIADCKKALEINPKESVALQNLGTAYLKTKDLDAALSAYSKVIELEPRWPAPYFERGKTGYRKGDYAAGLKDADKAYQLLGAEDPDLHYLRACCLMAKGNGKDAKVAFDLALKAADEGWILRRRAESLLSVLPELTAPSTVNFRRRLLEKGRELLSKGETDKSIEVLEEVVLLDAKTPEAHEALVGALLKRSDQHRGDRKRAKSLIIIDAVGLGKGLSPQMQRYLNAVCSQVLASLRWLAHHQMADGRWSGESVVEACRKDGTPQCEGKGKTGSDLRATSLAILAFLGAGYSHLSKDNYDTKPIGETVQKAQQWMIAQQKADGSFGEPASERFLEDHAIATLAISEAYGMTALQPLKAPAQKAVDFLAANRVPGKSWAVKARKDAPDPIATGWALFALQSARLSELKFPADAMDQGLEWLIGAGLEAQPARRDVAGTFAVAVAAFLGKKLDGDLLQAHLKAISEAPPGKAPEERDALFTFLSAVALRLGDNGALWQSWLDRAKMTLQEVARFDDQGNGCPAGSWDAVGPADGSRGRVITTSLNTLALEICFEYRNVFCIQGSDYTGAIEIEPKSAAAYFNRGLAKQNNGDLDGAIADYTRAIEIDPKLAAAYSNRGNVKLAKGDLDGSITDYTRAIELDPKYAAAYSNRGKAKQDKGELDGGIADYTRAIELDPRDAIARCNRGNAKLAKGDLDGALADYTRAIEIDPKYADAYFNRGNVQFDMCSWNDALADYRKRCELDPSNQAYPRFYVWLTRARLNERDAATKELARYFAERKTEQPEDWPSKIARLLTGDLSEDDFLKAAASKDPKIDREQKCEAYFYAGSRRLLEGDKIGAKVLFQKCIDTGVMNFTEYTSAAAELKRLGK